MNASPTGFSFWICSSISWRRGAGGGVNMYAHAGTAEDSLEWLRLVRNPLGEQATCKGTFPDVVERPVPSRSKNQGHRCFLWEFILILSDFFAKLNWGVTGRRLLSLWYKHEHLLLWLHLFMSSDQIQLKALSLCIHINLWNQIWLLSFVLCSECTEQFGTIYTKCCLRRKPAAESPFLNYHLRFVPLCPEQVDPLTLPWNVHWQWCNRYLFRLHMQRPSVNLSSA